PSDPSLLRSNSVMRDHASMKEGSSPGRSRQRYNTTNPGPRLLTMHLTHQADRWAAEEDKQGHEKPARPVERRVRHPAASKWTAGSAPSSLVHMRRQGKVGHAVCNATN